VETQQTARARQLQDMYNVLQNDLFDHDERIDILMTIKTTVKVCGAGVPAASQLATKLSRWPAL